MTKEKMAYYNSRRPFFPTRGKTYENEGGGTYVCLGAHGGVCTMANVRSGWTFLAHGVGIYEDGKIDWDYSTAGSFSEWLEEHIVQPPKQTFTRVTSHYDGRTLTERIYACDQVEAIERFRRAYPEQKDCILVAEDFHPEDPANEDYLKAYAKAHL